MLVLTRQINEKIVISDNITVTVLAVDDLKVSLGIKSPKNIPVFREEIYQKIKNEKKLLEKHAEKI
ncbi:carbon storage regulator CsrA [Aliikangiella coralliicola]|uniref:Translational regulator CsrA n=1 Tax=Aliikangiella coralliicola TaxID=2592383 RepID=A0A545UIU6_9GAMM|nr:carbon storage regulator CsrA [Aliikangiella coralliicola]TQV89395.1 carbon storage regulator CsrA [Aliikangiella coralliicola]